MRWQSSRRRRAAFTLVEMLLVIGIITILAALLLSAALKAIGVSDRVKVINEITQLQSALENFKSQFGFYPPSRIKLCEVFSDYDLSKQLDKDSVFYLTQMFKRLDDSNSDWNAGSPKYVNWNGNTAQDTPVILEGDQCLVFFLGGIPSPAGSGGNPPPGCLGFSGDPHNPSTPGGTRIGPFFDFQSSRLVILGSGSVNDPFQLNGTNPRGDHLPSPPYYKNVFSGAGTSDNLLARSQTHFSYLDPFGKNAYGYLSSYKRSNGYNRYFDATNLPFSDCIGLGWVGYSPPGGSSYTGGGQGLALWPYATKIDTTTTSNCLYQAANTYQIISAGRDGKFGTGSYLTNPPGVTTGALTWTPAQAQDVNPPKSRGADDLSSFYDRELGDPSGSP